MKILITGGAGFIAQKITVNLMNNFTILAPSRKELNCLDSIQVNNFFKNNNVDVVIHTALTGRENPFSKDPVYLSDSLIMWRNIYNNRHKFKKLIQFGTAYEFFLEKHNNEIDANELKNSYPMSAYGFAKNLMAKSCIETENFYNLRIFGNYHYSEKNNRFFKKLFYSSEFIIDYDRYFDYINLDDILKVVKFVITESPKIRDINLVYNKKYLLSELASIFCNINKINPALIVNPGGKNLTGNSKNLDDFNIKLEGLEKGFEKYHQNL